MFRFEALEFESAEGTGRDKPRLVGRSGAIPNGFKLQVEDSLAGWSGLGVVGFTTPVISSFLLKPIKERGPENFYTITVTWFGSHIHHKSFLVPESDFAKCGYNPYRFVAELGQDGFGDNTLVLPGWEGDRALGPEIKSLVIDGLQQLLSRGELHLPLAAPDTESDRILAILISALPVPTRAGLRFTSFCPVDPWGWNLAAVRQPGGSLVDWKRRVMDLVGNELDPQVAAYLQAVSSKLALGDELGLAELTRGTGFTPRLKAAGRTASISTSTVQSSERTIRGSIPLAGSKAKGNKQPVVTPGESATQKPRRRPRVVLEKRKLRNITLAESRRNRRIPGWVVMVFFLLTAGLIGWGAGVIPQRSLLGLSRKLTSGAEAPSLQQNTAQLFSVVDVARSYEDILLEFRSGHRGENSTDQKAGIKALSDLKKRAAAPLALQVENYLKVVGNGIQQGLQPGREVRRMEALGQEGQDLSRDLVRLKLAWFSLSQRIFWEDLGKIDDGLVVARLDSLAVLDKASLAQAESALEIVGLQDNLNLAVDQISAMAELVTLFQASSWSQSWQQELLACANRIPPAASPVTRAYRNSAFALGRVKNAEHNLQALQVPLGLGWGMGTWPVAEVRSQMPTLRRVAGMFPQGQAPRLIAGIVEVYSLLEDQSRAARLAASDPGYWLRLYSNFAVTSDPVAYANILGRLRFEALRPFLDRGDPADTWPEHLINKAMTEGIYEFYSMLASTRDPDVWLAYASRTSDHFLAAWAGYLGDNYGSVSRERLVAFTQEGEDLLSLSHKVKARAQSGRDCTAQWLDLHTTALAYLDRYVLAFSDSPVCQAQVAAASNMLEAISQPLSIHLTGVDIALDSVDEQGPLQMELAIKPAPKGVEEEVLVLAHGIVVRAGKGHVDLDTEFPLQPQQWLEIRVRNQSGGEVQLEAIVPSLLERVGPGGLSRELKAEGGTLSFEVEPGMWKGLKIPDLASIF